MSQLAMPTDAEADRPSRSPAALAVRTDEAARHEVLVDQLRSRHWSMLWLAVGVLAASLLLRPGGAESLRVRGFDIPLPPLCGSRTLFNVDCAGCGLTRSFVALARGDFRASFAYHRLGWLMAAVVAAQIPYRSLALWELRSCVVQRSWPKWFGYLLITALLANWLLP